MEEEGGEGGGGESGSESSETDTLEVANDKRRSSGERKKGVALVKRGWRRVPLFDESCETAPWAHLHPRAHAIRLKRESFLCVCDNHGHT